MGETSDSKPNKDTMDDDKYWQGDDDSSAEEPAAAVEKNPEEKREEKTAKRKRPAQATKDAEENKPKRTAVKKPPAKKQRVDRVALDDLCKLMHKQVDATIANAKETVDETKLSKTRKIAVSTKYAKAGARSSRMKKLQAENKHVYESISDFHGQCLSKTAPTFGDYARQVAELDYLAKMDE